MKKILVLATLSLALPMIQFCCRPAPTVDGVYGGKPVSYCMGIIFEDSEGNNLIEGIDLMDWSPSDKPVEEATFGIIACDYKFRIILEKPFKTDGRSILYLDSDKTEYNMLLYEKRNGYISLDFKFMEYEGFLDTQEILTFQIACPQIFGDDELHSIITFWNAERIKAKSEYFMECQKIVYEDQVITDIAHRSWSDEIYRQNVAKIVIDR